MVTPGQALWDTLREAYDSASVIVITNVLWFVFTILIVTAPAAAAGAHYSAYALAQRKPVDASTFFIGMRKYAWAGYQFFFINLFVIVLMSANFIAYGQFNTVWATWLQGIVLGLFIIWSGLNIFTFPLYLTQSSKKFLIALRNSLVFYLKMPGMSVSLYAFLLVLAALSTLLGVPWMLFSTILGLMLCFRFTLLMLAKFGFNPAEDSHPHVDINGKYF